MIIINLRGGMGNQMFQYALGKSLSVKNNEPFFLNTNFLNLVDFRNYDLDLFNIEERFIDLPSDVIELREEDNDLTFNEKIFNFDYSRKNVFLTGCFQHIEYFHSICDILKKEFTLKNPITNKSTLDLIEEISRSNSVMLSVRRTDYLTSPEHYALGVDYYFKAINLVYERVFNPKFYIFSDDLDWAVKNLNFINNAFYVGDSYNGDRYVEKFELMKSCKHFIISNSTFAFWPAYLATNPSKFVVAPRKWLPENSHKIDIINNRKLDWLRV